jgi:asparagine synthetase B (glutamine-hydrolysing)
MPAAVAHDRDVDRRSSPGAQKPGPRLSDPLELTSFEIASHIVLGQTPPRRLASSPSCLDPLRALEAAVRPALGHPPCLVSFSGGQDSSLVLAVAARVAGRDGLPSPIPITWRFTGAPKAEESAWQEAVVAALGLADWVRLPAGDDLDWVGPISSAVLLRHGLLYPANAFFHAPLLEEASGGSLLTGVGGDEVLGRSRRPRRPWWLAKRGAPGTRFTWMRPRAAASIDRAVRRDRRRVPRVAERRPRWRAESRYLAMTCSSFSSMAGAAGTDVAHPLLDVGFLSALEASGLTAEGAGSRAVFLRALFADQLPEICLAPRSKATFQEVFWRDHTRAHVADWDGEGIDGTVVDTERLRDAWHRQPTGMYTALLLQQTRLHRLQRDDPSLAPGRRT